MSDKPVTNEAVFKGLWKLLDKNLGISNMAKGLAQEAARIGNDESFGKDETEVTREAETKPENERPTVVDAEGTNVP